MKQKRNKTGRRLFSFLLALVLVMSNFTGIVPGMSLTAYAAGEKAYAAYDVTTETNKTKSGNDLTALQVTFNERQWYIIEDNSSSGTSGTVTLLSADTSFGTKKFGSDDKYSTSEVKTYLDSMTEAGEAFAGVAEAIETVNLTTNKYNSTEEYETVNGVRLYLLSTEEANSLPNNVRKAGFTTSGLYNEWWLRSPGYHRTKNDYAAFVQGHNGNVNSGGVTVSSYTFGVRPALKLDLSKVTFDSENKEFSLGSPKTVQTVTAPTKATGLTYKKDQAQALLIKGAEVTTGNQIEGSIQYKVGADGTWSTEIPKGTNAGNYDVYYKVLGDDTYAEYAPTTPITVTIAKADPVTPTGITAKYGDDTGKINLPEGWTWNDYHYFQTVGTDTVKADFAGNDNYNAKTGVDITVEVGKADVAISYEKTEVSVELNAEFGKNEITNPGDAEPTFTSTNESVATVSNTGYVRITGLGETTITATVEDNAHYHYTTKEASYKLTVNPISTQISTAPTAAEITYGQKLSESTLTGGEAVSRRSPIEGTFAWKEPDLVPNASDNGQYDVVFTPKDTNYAESTCKVTIKVNKKTVSVKDLEDAQKPVAKTGDDTVYTGEPIELVTAPTADLPLDYEAYYSTDDGDSWSTDIPKKTDSGTYIIKVKYVSKGNNCNDITLDDITVTITPADKKALTDAITAAKAYYDTIKGITDYSEAADKLDKAIKAAEEVAAKNKVTKAEVSTATEALNTAKTTAEAEVKDIADTKAAQAVSDKIAALPAKDEVTKEDKKVIEEARAAYNALTEDQKAKVTPETLKKLKDAEDKLAVLLAMSEVSAKTGSDMTYTGNPIQLINTPTTKLPAGYKMVYAVTTEKTAPTDESLYTTSIPAATNAGTYYVWYYIEGKDGVNDTSATCITVTIAEESLKVKTEKAKKNNIATISDNIMIVPDAKGKVWTLDASLIDASSNEIAVKVTFTAGAKIKLNGYDKKKTKSFKDMNKASRKTATISTKGILKAKKAGTGIIKYATADGKIVTIEYTVVKPAIAVADGKDASVNSVATGSVKKLKATYTAAGNFDVKLTGVPLNSLYTFKGKKVLNENNIVIGEDGCLHITGELEARKTAKVIINAQGKKYTVLITGKFR